MLPYFVYPVVFVTIALMVVVPPQYRFGPIVLIGGVHLIYNMMSLLLSQEAHKLEQYVATVATFALFALGAVLAARFLPKARLSRPPVASFRPGALVAHVRRARTSGRATSFELHLPSLGVRPLVFTASFAVAITAYGYLVYRAGSLPVLHSNPNDARLSFFLNGYFSTIVYVGLVGCAVAGGIAAMSAGIASKPYLEIAVVVISLGALGATGNRGMLVYPLVVLGLCAFVRYRIRLAYAVGLGILGLVAFSVAGYSRNKAAWGYTYDDDLAEAGYPGVLKYLGPLGQYVGGTAETFSRTLDVFPDRVPFQMGEQFFSPLLHRQSVDFYLKDVFNLEFEGFGLAPGAMNAFYIDFGWPGVAIGFLLLGVGAGYLYGLAVNESGRFVPAYLLLCTNLVLANYGHPFAYIATIAAPIAVIVILTPVARAGQDDVAGPVLLSRLVSLVGSRSRSASTSG